MGKSKFCVILWNGLDFEFIRYWWPNLLCQRTVDLSIYQHLKFWLIADSCYRKQSSFDAMLTLLWPSETTNHNVNTTLGSFKLASIFRLFSHGNGSSFSQSSCIISRGTSWENGQNYWWAGFIFEIILYTWSDCSSIHCVYCQFLIVPFHLITEVCLRRLYAENYCFTECLLTLLCQVDNEESFQSWLVSTES